MARKSSYEYVRAYRDKMRAEGRCIVCGASPPLAIANYCTDCADRLAERNRLARARIAARAATSPEQPTRKVVVKLTATEKQRLEATAKRNGVAVAELVRETLRAAGLI
jgi:hypothetical protein